MIWKTRSVLGLVGFAVAGGLTAACAGSQPPAGSSGGDVCASSQEAAVNRVEKVVSDNQTCAADADCAAIEVHTTCFDTCYRVVNTAGKGAVDRAETLVEAAECKEFHEHDCKLVIPPCAPPPGAVKCTNGKCADG
jgi:hypothetical protein